MTELGSAYVQIIPSARGIKGKITQSISGEAGAAGNAAGTSIGKRMIGALGAVGIGAAVGKIFMSAIKEGAALEQSMGGIETMFKKSSGTVIANAKKAWKTAGLSANQYMEQTTSFSASLLQSLDGNTKKAAASADMAVRDMADNSNKFGTNIQDIQNAYQGFAKQNYTMLDNLKLGYGGTKTEMQRLLSDAEKISGQKYDISNLNDVYSAIHVVQNEMGVTGTTSKEAATTLSGSFASMKAAAQNFAGYMTTGSSKQTQKALMDLLSSVGTFLGKNLLPAVGKIIVNLGKIIVQQVPKLYGKLTQALLNLANKIASGSSDGSLKAGLAFAGKIALGILKGIGTINLALLKLIGALLKVALAALGRLIAIGLKWVGGLATGFLKGASKPFVAMGKIVASVVKRAVAGAARMVAAGLRFVVRLATGIARGTRRGLSAIGKVATAIIRAAIRAAARMVSAGLQFAVRLATGIRHGVGRAVSAIRSVISRIISAARSAVRGFLSIGGSIVSGLWNGISNKAQWLKNMISGFVGNIKGWLKKMFKIGSPSKVMRNEIGRWIPAGIAVGIADNADMVKTSLQDMVSGSTEAAIPALRYGAAVMPDLVPRAAAGGQVYNMTFNVDGTRDPGEYAQRLARSLKRNLRAG